MLGSLSKSNYFKQRQGARGFVSPSILFVSIFFSSCHFALTFRWLSFYLSAFLTFFSLLVYMDNNYKIYVAL